MTGDKVDVSKVQPLCFDPFNRAYHVMGDKVGEAWGSGTGLMICSHVQVILIDMLPKTSIFLLICYLVQVEPATS